MRKIIFLVFLIVGFAHADEPKHINPPVVVEGESVSMKLEFWKHTVETMNYQAQQINEQQTTILLLRASLKEKENCVPRGGL